jgi:hypothetical protein
MRDFFRNSFVLWMLGLFIVLGIFVWFVLLAPYFAYYPICTFRYKLSAEVMTPGGLKTGSSVWEVSYSHGADYGGGESAQLSITGEAVYVDLGKSKNLFVLLTNRAAGRKGTYENSGRNYVSAEGPLDPFSLPLNIYGLIWHFGHEDALCAAFESVDLKRLVEVPFKNIPTLVHFDNMNNSNTVEVVQPEKLSESYGAGYFLKRLTMSPTNDQATEKIEVVLPWLSKLKPKDSSITITAVGPLLDRLHYISFKSFKHVN